MLQQAAKYSAEQMTEANNAALTIEAMIGRLSYDEGFARDLANNPMDTLTMSGMLMDKEAIQVLLATDPDRFDKLCESLFALVDSDFLHAIVGPSCD
ncbi:hypothetical protein [Streptacidiphilus albus]|uniref:hypothetical protein n=1 Tax=Streptacidiphilus albus TaxID=105425 RepID=UPI00054B759E|nr:hypothetical protein [Streptacidiphilus albus]